MDGQDKTYKFAELQDALKYRDSLPPPVGGDNLTGIEVTTAPAASVNWGAVFRPQQGEKNDRGLTEEEKLWEHTDRGSTLANRSLEFLLTLFFEFPSYKGRAELELQRRGFNYEDMESAHKVLAKSPEFIKQLHSLVNHKIDYHRKAGTLESYFAQSPENAVPVVPDKELPMVGTVNLRDTEHLTSEACGPETIDSEASEVETSQDALRQEKDDMFSTISGGAPSQSFEDKLNSLGLGPPPLPTDVVTPQVPSQVEITAPVTTQASPVQETFAADTGNPPEADTSKESLPAIPSQTTLPADTLVPTDVPAATETLSETSNTSGTANGGGTSTPIGEVTTSVTTAPSATAEIEATLPTNPTIDAIPPAMVATESATSTPIPPTPTRALTAEEQDAEDLVNRVIAEDNLRRLLEFMAKMQTIEEFEEFAHSVLAIEKWTAETGFALYRHLIPAEYRMWKLYTGEVPPVIKFFDQAETCKADRTHFLEPFENGMFIYEKALIEWAKDNFLFHPKFEFIQKRHNLFALFNVHISKHMDRIIPFLP